jgi:spore coat-associated protein N
MAIGNIGLVKVTLLSLLVLTAAAVVSFGLSTAIFTSTATVGSNTFSTGTVDLTTSPTSALVTFSTMSPGDQVTAPITVTNAGSLTLRYAVTSTTTENTLAGQLQLTIKSGVTTCTNAGFGSTGTVLYGPGVLGTTGGTNVIGNPAQGAQTGDRTLNASANEPLCFNVSLPLSSGNSFQNLTTTATFTFNGEQTTNNP